MLTTVASHSEDLAAAVVRALVLYSLAEFQAGHATTIRVRAQGLAFEVSDDGRGHAIERTIAAQPYLNFVYTHLDFPFAQAAAPPVQLHTIGTSFINTLCSELVVTVHRQGGSLRRTYRDGRLTAHEEISTHSASTGTSIAGSLRAALQQSHVDVQRPRQWLMSVAGASPGLHLHFNGSPIPPHNAS